MQADYEGQLRLLLDMLREAKAPPVPSPPPPTPAALLHAASERTPLAWSPSPVAHDDLGHGALRWGQPAGGAAGTAGHPAGAAEEAERRVSAAAQANLEEGRLPAMGAALAAGGRRGGPGPGGQESGGHEGGGQVPETGAGDGDSRSGDRPADKVRAMQAAA